MDSSCVFALTFALAGLGCPAAEPDDDGAPADDGTASGADTDADGPGATSMLPGDTGMADGGDGLSGASFTTSVDTGGGTDSPGADSGGGSEADVDSGGSSSTCEGIDHGACWAEIDAAWESNGPLDAATIAAFEACYANPSLPLPSERLIDLCTAELQEECLSGGGAECGAAYCECTLGSDPFDWTSCYAITMAACDQGSTFSGSDECLGIVEASGCWPRATSEQVGACYDSTNQGEGSCACPMCVDDWAACDATMEACVSVP